MISAKLPSRNNAAARHSRVLMVLLVAGVLVSCSDESSDPAVVADLQSYHEAISNWHSARVERLKGEDGFLNLAGLFWLTEGRYRMGSAPGSEILLAVDKAAPLVGTLSLKDHQVTFAAAKGVEVRLHDVPVTQMVLAADDSATGPDLLTHGSLAWFVIRRGDQFGLRLRDFESAALARFPGIKRFPVDPRWRVQARLERYPEPRRIAVDTVVDGLLFEPVSPGVLVFELDGRRLQLEAYGEDGGEEFFILFADSTSGITTYGAGRFLAAPWIDAQQLTVLDFNRAYNPPCAFNDFATCPIAPLKNHLSVAIEAGEQYTAGLHVAGR